MSGQTRTRGPCWCGSGSPVSAKMCSSFALTISLAPAKAQPSVKTPPPGALGHQLFPSDVTAGWRQSHLCKSAYQRQTEIQLPGHRVMTGCDRPTATWRPGRWQCDPVHVQRPEDQGSLVSVWSLRLESLESPRPCVEGEHESYLQERKASFGPQSPDMRVDVPAQSPHSLVRLPCTHQKSGFTWTPDNHKPCQVGTGD